ncbi:MAG: acyl-CoA thioesterase [Candidatus Aminicenantaceae bacterium]
MKSYRNSGKYGNRIDLIQDKNKSIEIEIRVRYSETDKMGVAHNKSYFEWFEIGRTEYCRQKGIPYRDIEKKGYYLVVAEAYCRYKKSLRYDEKFLIRVRLEEITPKKAVFTYELLTIEEKKLIASGHTIHIVTNSKAKACSLPRAILDKIKS